MLYYVFLVKVYKAAFTLSDVLPPYLGNVAGTSGSVDWNVPTNRFRDLLFLVRIEMAGGRVMRMRRIIKIGVCFS